MQEDKLGLLLKSLFSRKFRKLKNSLREIHIGTGPTKFEDNFLGNLTFFSRLFYHHGFLSSYPRPAFANAYKNISEDILRETYMALPVYFSFRYRLANSNFKTVEELRTALLKLYPTLDSSTLDNLLSEWSKANPEELDDLLYEHFNKYGVFEKVFAEGSDVGRWFKNYLNQTYDYALQAKLR